MKKAQMEYNWAFVIIAGAVILGFFVTLTVRYIDIQNLKENAIIASDIYNNLFNLQKSVYATQLNLSLTLVTKLDFSCNQLMVGNFVPAGLEKEFIFSPREMQTDKISIFVQPWKYPFKIGNLFYISSNQKKYYILYDSNSADFVSKLELPKNFNIQKTNSMPKKDENTRIISFSSSQNGDVKFIDGNENVMINGIKSPIFGMPLLYGAIFSENYPCMLDKLLKRFSMMIDIYKGKADYLFMLNTNCDYSQIKFTLSNLKSKIESKNYNEIKNYVKILDEQNNNLLSINCQPLY